MSRQLCKSLFTIDANSKTSYAIALAYQGKALHSIQHIVSTVQKVTGIDQSVLLKKLNRLRDYAISSKLYVYNSVLVKCLTIDRDIKKIIATLSDLKATPISQLINPGYAISNLSTVSWGSEFSNDTINDANNIFGAGYADIIPVNEELFAKHQKIVAHSLSILKLSKASDFLDELTHYVSDIILFDGHGVTGGSSTRMMGSIFIRIHDKANMNDYHLNELSLSYLTPEIYYLEQIVHETAHLHLDQLMEFDSLVTNDPAERYDSPIRKDQRPMRGVFHATFVLARIYQLLTSGCFHDPDNELSRKMRIPPVYKALLKGLNILQRDAEFTSSGFSIFNEMKASCCQEHMHAA